MPRLDDAGVLAALVRRDQPVPKEAWHAFWDRLRARTLHPGEALAVVSSLSTRAPDAASVQALLNSLRERAEPVGPPAPGTVNIVGTGGGPRTFNLSTAAALVAASIGARVIKTGSRAYTSRRGSVDLLELLGVPVTASPAQTSEVVETLGIAFAGAYVYPAELRLLARSILPFDLRAVGGFFNALGPSLAAVPVTAQLTGVSDPQLRPVHVALAANAGRRVLVVSNALGVDELVSVSVNVVHDAAVGHDRCLHPGALGLGPGTVQDLRPAESADATVAHFRALLGGRGRRAAVESIALNAAALAVAGGVVPRWDEGVRAALAAMEEREPLRLLERLSHAGMDRVGVLP
jgi:anthranilate phosphoribosyltransferase